MEEEATAQQNDGSSAADDDAELEAGSLTVPPVGSSSSTRCSAFHVNGDQHCNTKDNGTPAGADPSRKTNRRNSWPKPPHWPTSARKSIGPLATRSRPRTGTDGSGSGNWKSRPAKANPTEPSVRVFKNKMMNAVRGGLACFLATGISMIYPWSNNITWWAITLSISGVGRNLGHTVEGIRQSWLGAVVAVPLCLILGACSFSRALTGVLVALVIMAISKTQLLTEPAKKLCGVFIVWDVLIPAVSKITLVKLLEDLLKAVLGASIINFVVMIVPVPQLATWTCCRRLVELEEVMTRFLENAVGCFCLRDDNEVMDLEEIIEGASALLQEVRSLLPDVRMELSLSLGRDRAVAFDRLSRYLDILESQIENFRGMSTAVGDLYPNATHSEFIQSLRPSLHALVSECSIVLEGTCNHICNGLGFGSKEDEDLAPELFSGPKHALTYVLNEMLRTRMKVVYGVELVIDDAGNIAFERSDESTAAACAFMEESKKIGYMNLLPRNAFILDLELFVNSFETYVDVCNSIKHEVPVSCSERTRAFISSFSSCLEPWLIFTQSREHKWWKPYVQPFKVGLAEALSSITVLSETNALGPQTIWGPIAVCQSMSSHPSSAFRSGANRIQGTVLGAVFGLAVTQWIPIHHPVAIVLVLTVWVFACAFNKGNPSYGEVAVSAALTPPIIVIGPVVGSSGAVVRIAQVILGTVIYVVVDNLIYPSRAKLLLRKELVGGVKAMLNLCEDSLAFFLAGPAAQNEERDRREAGAVRDHLNKEAFYISLATDEPELWHKPFQKKAYLKCHSIQLRLHRYLLMLHRSSVAFPKELADWDQDMLRSYETVILRLKTAVLTILSEVLARLESLKVAAPMALPRANLFRIRQEFSEIQETIDRFVELYFSKDPVLTSLEFIVTLNGMIYSTQLMSNEVLKFATAVRDLTNREKGYYKRRRSTSKLA